MPAEGAQRQWQTMEQRLGIPGTMYRGQQRERLPVGADDEVLAVVEGDSAALDAAGASAERLGLLEQRDRDARGGEGHRSGATCPPAADDGDVRRGGIRHGALSSRRSTACAKA